MTLLYVPHIWGNKKQEMKPDQFLCLLQKELHKDILMNGIYKTKCDQVIAAYLRLPMPVYDNNPGINSVTRAP